MLFHPTRLVLTLGLALGSVAAYADDDSSADAGAAFASKVSESTGAIVRVPLNERGEEVPTQAELHLHFGAQPQGNDVATAFNAGVDASTQRAVTAADINADSSTSGWYHGGSYNHNDGYNGGYDWRPNYNNWNSNYYYNYRPTYYYGGNYWNYNYGYNYNYYYSRPYNGCGGYRYYYYNRWYR